MAVRIVTDSAADLTDEESEALDVAVVPLSIRFGSEEYVDRRDLTPAEFYAKLASATVLPETAAPSPGAFEVAFRSCLDAEAAEAAAREEAEADGASLERFEIMSDGRVVVGLTKQAEARAFDRVEQLDTWYQVEVEAASTGSAL